MQILAGIKPRALKVFEVLADDLLAEAVNGDAREIASGSVATPPRPHRGEWRQADPKPGWQGRR